MFDATQLKYIEKGKRLGLPFEKYAKEEFNGAQMKEIYYALRHGINVDDLLIPEMPASHMQVKREAVLAGVDVKNRSIEDVTTDLVHKRIHGAFIHLARTGKFCETNDNYHYRLSSYLALASSHLSKSEYIHIRKYVDKAYSILSVDSLKPVVNEFKTMISMVKDYVKGDYREITVTEVAIILAVIIYVVVTSPDDTIPIIGEVDDVAVISWAASLLSNDLEDYKEWKKNQQAAVPEEWSGLNKSETLEKVYGNENNVWVKEK